MAGLVHQGGGAAMANEMKALEGGKPDFDPLMSMHWHWSNFGMQYGGLNMLIVDDASGADNAGHKCPLCEWKRNVSDVDPQASIDSVADQMRIYCIAEKLIPESS